VVILRSLKRIAIANKISAEDTAFAVASLTIALHKEPDNDIQEFAQLSLIRFAKQALPIDPDAGLLLVQRVEKSNGGAASKGGEWFAKGLAGKEQGIRSALFNSSLLKVPSDVLFAKYIDRNFLNHNELTVLDPASKTFQEAKFNSSLSPIRFSDFLLSRRIAKAQIELFHRNPRLPLALSTISACLLIEWRESSERKTLDN